MSPSEEPRSWMTREQAHLASAWPRGVVLTTAKGWVLACRREEP